MATSASDNIFIINPALPIRNGLVTIEPQPGQLASGVAPVSGQGIGGYHLSHRVPDEREQDFSNIDGYGVGIIGGRYLERSDPPYRAAVAATAADYASSGGTNLSAIVNYPSAGIGRCHVLGGVAWGLSTVAPFPSGVTSPSPSGSFIQIEDGSGNIVFKLPVTNLGQDSKLFDPPKRFSPNTQLRVTLFQAGAAISGDVSILEHWTV